MKDLINTAVVNCPHHWAALPELNACTEMLNLADSRDDALRSFALTLPQATALAEEMAANGYYDHEGRTCTVSPRYILSQMIEGTVKLYGLPIAVAQT